jgi:hypothetical protein
MARKGWKKLHEGKFDTEFRFVIENNPALAPWADLLRDYWAAELPGKRRRTASLHTLGLTKFAIAYLHGQGLAELSVDAFFEKDRALPSLEAVMGVNQSSALVNQHDRVVDFLDWVLRERLSAEDVEGHRVVPEHLALPFQRLRKKTHGKEGDLDFMHVVRLDPKLEDWRALAATWLKEQTLGVARKRQALDRFLTDYLHDQDLDRNFGQFLLRSTPKPAFMGVSLAAKSKGSAGASPEDIKSNNYVTDFLDWVLETQLGDEGVWDVTRFHNPVPRLKQTGLAAATESNKSVLSITYIKECRSLLAEGPTLSDWTWAQSAISAESSGGDWFVVNSQRVDRSDPDCVWRERETSQYEREVKGYPATVTELWSPVRAVALYLKLELPLRLMQVRMLDSGEADTYRYERDVAGDGRFVENTGPHATGSAKRPYMRGVFHRAQGATDAGLFINTNKTADINKTENDKGYVIPWAHPTVLYWLVKLRDWQVRYNPVSAPVAWTELESKHFGRTPPHPGVLAQRGTACFLFRDPCAKRPDLPLISEAVERLWVRLLERLQAACVARGETFDNGESMVFVEPGSEKGSFNPLFPLHALRVSLISYLILDAGLDPVIVSKLIAGHSTIIMTLYYTKIGNLQMREVMEKAEREFFEADQKNHRRFLQEATMQEVAKQFSALSDDAYSAGAGARGPSMVFDDKGICPVGGMRCNEGGAKLIDRKGGTIFGPVPGWPRSRNCTSCRFFLTGPAYLSGMMAHANATLERTHASSGNFIDLEERLRELQIEQQRCEEEGRPFLKAMEVGRLEQRHREAEEDASLLINDLNATWVLIQRSLTLLNERRQQEGIPLVAAGTMEDITIGFIETASEFHQLEVVCQNAEIHVNPEVRPAIYRRSQMIDLMLRFNRIPPILGHFDEKTQLQIGNAVMNLIKARTGSIQRSVPFAECQKKLSELGIKAREIEEEMAHVVGGPKVQQLIASAKALRALPDTDKEQE